MTTGQGDVVAYILDQDALPAELLKGQKTPVNIEGLLAYIQENGGEALVVPGSDTELLFNDGGALGAIAVLTWDGVTLKADAPVVINETGADVDIRVEGVGEANALFVQGSDGKVGIGTGAPASQAHIVSLLDEATGDEAAMQVDYTTNKATSGDDAGVQINLTDTATPGVSRLLETSIDGSPFFNIRYDGTIPGAGPIELVPSNLGGGSALNIYGQGAFKAYIDMRNGAPRFVAGGTDGAAALHSALATVTTPNILPVANDINTGIGRDGADVLSLIAGGVSGLKINNVGPVLPSYTVATLPAATTAAGMIYVTDETGGAIPAFSDGVNWRRVTDRAIVS